MDPIDVLSRALDQTGNLLDQVGTDVLARPTPCSDWDVAALADHIINDPRGFLLMMRGEQPDWSSEPPQVGSEWAQVFRSAADDLIHPWHQQGDQADKAQSEAEAKAKRRAQANAEMKAKGQPVPQQEEEEEARKKK